MADEHFLHSSHREALLEHLFVGEIMRHVWLSEVRRLEVLKPQVDDSGYDLVLETEGIVRHVQLKATFGGSTIRNFNVNIALASKPSGCIVGLRFDPATLELGPFLWFGAAPGEPLPSLEGLKIGKHTKANAQGVKSQRAAVRVLPFSRFRSVGTIADLAELLFGPNVRHSRPSA